MKHLWILSSIAVLLHLSASPSAGLGAPVTRPPSTPADAGLEDPPGGAEHRVGIEHPTPADLEPSSDELSVSREDQLQLPIEYVREDIPDEYFAAIYGTAPLPELESKKTELQSLLNELTIPIYEEHYSVGTYRAAEMEQNPLGEWEMSTRALSSDQLLASIREDPAIPHSMMIVELDPVLYPHLYDIRDEIRWLMQAIHRARMSDR